MAAFAQLPWIARFEAWLGRLPPWAAFIAFIGPSTLILPVKLSAFWFVLHGHYAMAVFVVVVAMLMASFLRTDLGLAVRATGENETMIQALGVDTSWTKIVGLGLSNFLIALSGALVAQNHGFADIGMGIGIDKKGQIDAGVVPGTELREPELDPATLRRQWDEMKRAKVVVIESQSVVSPTKPQ